MGQNDTSDPALTQNHADPKPAHPPERDRPHGEGAPHDDETQATTEEFGEEGMGVAAKE